MMLLGYEHSEIEPFAQAIENKDTSSPKDFFTKIIHDADCLEIIRCCSEKENYKKEYLDILKDLKIDPGFEIELDQMIENHFETIKVIEGDKRGSGPLHVKCEFSDNCYATLVSSMKNMLLTKAVIEAAESKKDLDLSEIKAEDFTSIDLFNRQNSPLVKRLLDDYSVSLQISESENDPAISLYQNYGLLARVINSDRIDDEIDTLEKNAIAMRNASIENSEQMRRFISDQTGKAFAPAGFKWRPCTFIENGLPVIELHLSDGKVITQETNKLPSIANKYFEQATERLQSHINNIDIKKELSEIGILNLDIRFVMKGKPCLALAFEVATEFNKEAIQEKLLNMLGLPKVRNFNSDFLQRNYPNYQQGGNQVIFSIGDVQKIDSFVNRLSLRELKRLERSSVQPMFNNSQTMWNHQRIPLSEAHAINKIDAKKTG